MTQRQLSGILATGAAVLVAVSACGGAKPSALPTASAKPTSISASPTSPTLAASARATALMYRYFAVLDNVSQQPRSNLDALSSVAVSSELTAEQRFLASEHQRGERQVGATQIAQLKVQSVNLDNSNPSAGIVPTVTVDVCWDVSKVDVLDKNGKSIVSSTRPNTGWTRYIVANYQYATDPTNGWRVASAQDLGHGPCNAS